MLRYLNYRENYLDGFKATLLNTLFDPDQQDVQGSNLLRALELLFDSADKAISEGSNILILSDRGIDKKMHPFQPYLHVRVCTTILSVRELAQRYP